MISFCFRCVRNNINETAQFWFEKIYQIFELRPQDGMVNILTAIRFMEGFTLQLHTATSNMNFGVMISFESEIRSMIKSIKAAIKISKAYDVRLMFLDFVLMCKEFHKIFTDFCFIKSTSTWFYSIASRKSCL